MQNFPVISYFAFDITNFCCGDDTLFHPGLEFRGNAVLLQIVTLPVSQALFEGLRMRYEIEIDDAAIRSRALSPQAGRDSQ